MKLQALLLLVSLTAWTTRADHAGAPHKSLVNVNQDGVAIGGYDPVAYFTQSKPIKGETRFQARHDQALYYFSTADHKARFEKMPEKYVPAYGGYCGYAASINRLSPISPEWWQIENNRLILQHNRKALDLFNKELSGNVAKADANWPGLVAKNGSSERVLVSVDKQGVALEGYDPVTYFEGTPRRGQSGIEGTFGGAKYQFLTQENRATFEIDPSKYAPAYGGFCGYAASIGKVRPANPLLWSIVDGVLIVQRTSGAVDLWNQDVQGNKAKADIQWPGLVAVNAGKRKATDPR